MATQLATADQSTALTLPPEAEHFALRQRQARMFAMSLLVPQHLRNGTPEQAMANCYIALTLAEAMGEMPLIVMQNIHVINGKASFASKYMIARANASGKFRDDLDWDIAGQGKTLSATCYATLGKSGKRVQMTVDMAMAESEGWTKNSKYKTMPELMLRYRSASFLVNLYAPEVMLGYRSIEELEDMKASGVLIEESEPLTGQALLEQAREDTPPSPAGTPEAEAGPPSETEEVAASVSEGPDDSQRGDGDADREARGAIASYIQAVKEAPNPEALAEVQTRGNELAATIRADFPDLYAEIDPFRPADAPERGEGAE